MTTMGNIHFGQKTEEYYREFIEAPFFRRHLDTPSLDSPTPPPLPAAVVFEVGTNIWRRYEQWPPGEPIKTTFWMPVSHEAAQSFAKIDSGQNHET